MREQFAIQRTPIRADTNRLAMLHRLVDDRAKLPITLFAKTDIARIDPVFVERLGTGGMIRQQLMPDIVEITHQRHGHAALEQPFPDFRHGCRRFIPIHRDPDEFGTGPP
jgi:hypothetical protein